MTHCLNPDCQNPQNPDKVDSCQTCGSNLLLKNRYRAIYTLAEGTFGRTFLAVDEDKPSQPRCAIKQFFPQDAQVGAPLRGNGTFRPCAAQLDELGKHAQIPELWASFEQDGYQYLVQEYIEGQNLAREIAEKGTFNESKIRQLLNDLLPVLQVVHTHQVIHGDIKPENIIRRNSGGHLVLVDFGSAQFANGLNQIKGGTVTGSAEYAAPEQTKARAVFASDLYSLGVTCIHLLTNLPPFDLFDIKAEAWVWRDYLKNPVSHHLSSIIDKLLQRDQVRRYQSAADVYKDLNHAPIHAYLPPQKTKVATAIAGAAIAILSLTLSNRLQSPTPVVSYTAPEPLYDVPEVPYTLPELEDVTPEFSKNVQPMRTLAIASGPIWSVAVSPDGSTIASGSTDGTIQLWQVGVGDIRVPIRTLAGHSDPVWSLAISPDGQLLASGSSDKTIKVWDLATGELLRTLKGHSAGVFSVAFSPDSQTLASGSFDKTIKIWRLEGSEYGGSFNSSSRTLFGHSQEVQSVAFSPDGKTVASGSSDGTVKVWNWRSGKLLSTLSDHTDSVWSVAISPDGQTLASGSWDKTIKLWDLSTGMPLDTLMGHAEQIHSVAFSPDGERLASGDVGGTIKLWQLTTGDEIGTLKGHSDWVEVAFSPTGKTLVSGSFDDTIKLWRLYP